MDVTKVDIDSSLKDSNCHDMGPLASTVAEDWSTVGVGVGRDRARPGVTEDRLNLWAELESSSPAGIVVSAGRATRVQQAAVTSGIQRTLTVTSRRPVGRSASPTWGGGGGRSCMACKCSPSVGAEHCLNLSMLPGTGR